MVKGQKLLTISVKRSILDVWQGSDYTLGRINPKFIKTQKKI